VLFTVSIALVSKARIKTWVIFTVMTVVNVTIEVGKRGKVDIKMDLNFEGF
jgi:hypothetical protein